MSRPADKPGVRAALSHVGGPSRRTGDDVLSAILEDAFDVGEDDHDATRAHVHGFHSYPARLHAVTAQRLIDAFGGPGKALLDPFCGSGTVLVEGRVRGMRVVGTDVNPLAIRLAKLKTRGVPAVERSAILEGAHWIARHVESRRRTRARVTRRYPDEDVRLFPPHVLLELDSLRDGLDQVEPAALREDLELVFSAILTKVSHRRGDSGAYLQQRRLPPGFASRLFVQKAEELTRALEAFEKAVPAGAPPPDVHADDARTLGTLSASTFDLVLTSPPYAATYDYVDHHDVRLRWLGMRLDRFSSLELGARRDYAQLDGFKARRRWNDELGRTLFAVSRAMKPEGKAVFVIADSAAAGMALRALDIVGHLAGPANLRVSAAASQQRPHFHSGTRHVYRDGPREEHLILLEKLDPNAKLGAPIAER